MLRPPESELCVPIKESSPPSAPAVKIPCIGFSGLFPVSFDEREGTITPSTFASAAGLALSRIPASIAESK